MKKNLIIVLGLLVWTAASVFVGTLIQQKDSAKEEEYYEAACLESDFIRYYFDSLEHEQQIDFINQWGTFFEGIDVGSMKTSYIRSKKFLYDYSWCY